MYFIGINGGGKNTDAVLFEESGKVLAFVRGEASSQIAGHDEVSFAHLGQSLDLLLKGREDIRVDWVFAGISGTMENKQRRAKVLNFLKNRFPEAKAIDVLNDAANAFRSISPTGDGIVANVSTGSSVFYMAADQVGQIGGWGYLLADEGSAYDLGRRVLVCVLREKDGRGSSTKMTALLEKKLGMSVTDALPGIYEGGRVGIASFASVLFDAVREKDVVASKQLEESARAIAQAIRTAGAKLNTALLRVALSGSMWNEKLYYNAVDHIVGGKCQLIIPAMPKVYGAAVQALQLSGMQWSREFEKMFKETLKK